MTLLPLDSNSNPIPALRLKNNGAHTMAVSSTSARNANAFDSETRIVSVYSDVDVYLAMGGSTVSASSSDHYFPAGVYYDFAIGDDNSGHNTHIAAIAVDGSGTIYISEKY